MSIDLPPTYPGGAMTSEGIPNVEISYVEKPFSAAVLAEKVRGALEN